MGCCASKPLADSPPLPTRTDSQQHRPLEETIELRKTSSPPDLPPGPDTTPSPTDSVQPVRSASAPTPHQPDDTSQSPPPGPGRPSAPRSLPKAKSSSLHHLGGWQVSEGETSQKPSLSSHHFSRTLSADPLRHRNDARYQPLGVAASDGNGKGTDPRVGLRADKKRAATRDNNAGPLLPAVQEMLPPGFRYAL